MRADLLALSIGMASFGTITIFPNLMACSPMALTGSGVWMSSGILGIITSITDCECAVDILKFGGITGFVLHLLPMMHYDLKKSIMN